MPKRKTAKRPRRGRPPLPASQVLGAVLPIRCRKAEKAAFEASAASCGLALSVWIRKVLREAAALAEN